MKVLFEREWVRDWGHVVGGQPRVEGQYLRVWKPRGDCNRNSLARKKGSSEMIGMGSKPKPCIAVVRGVKKRCSLIVHSTIKSKGNQIIMGLPELVGWAMW